MDIEFSLRKIGIFSFVEIKQKKGESLFVGRSLMRTKPILSEEAEKNLEEESKGQLLLLAPGKIMLAKVITEIMTGDVRRSKRKAQKKALLAKKVKGGKPFRFRKEDKERMKGKSFVLVEQIVNSSPKWKAAFSASNAFLIMNFWGVFFGKETIMPGGAIIKNEEIFEQQKIPIIKEKSESIEKGCVLKDVENFYCLKRYMENMIKNPNRMGSLFGPDDSVWNPLDIKKLCKNGIYEILKADTIAKKRTITTWPKVVSNIEILPQTSFERHVKDPWEIRAHFALRHIDKILGRSEPGKKMIKIIKKSSKEQLQSACRKYAQITRQNPRLSSDKIKGMFEYLRDCFQFDIDADTRRDFQESWMRANSLRGLVRIAEDFHHDFNRYMESRGKIRTGNYHLPWPMINPNFEKNGVKVTFLCTSQQVRDEGNIMRHCIGSSVGSAFKMRRLIFHVEYQGQKATVALDDENNSAIIPGVVENWIVSGSFGPKNHKNKASAMGEKIMKQWARKLNKYMSKMNAIPEGTEVTFGEQVFATVSYLPFKVKPPEKRKICSLGL
jgi:hypothetical protein